MTKKSPYYYVYETCLKIGNFFKLIGDFFSDLPSAIIPPRRLADIAGIYFSHEKRIRHWSRNTDNGLSPREEEFITRYDIKKGSFLVIASGGGREAFALGRRGFNVTAIDISEGLIRFCRDKAERENIRNVDFQCAALQNFETKKKFDYVFFSGRSYNYIPTKTKRIESLKKIRIWIKPEGRFLLDFATGTRSINNKRKYFYPIYKCLAYITFGNREIERGDSTCNEGFRHNFMSEEDVVTEVKQAGFNIEKSGSDLFLKPQYVK